MNDYIPARIYGYYYPISFKDDHYNIISTGRLVCPCSSGAFSIQYAGQLSKLMFNRVELCPTAENELVIVLICRDCGGGFLLFDNGVDGYDALVNRAGHSASHGDDKADAPEYRHNGMHALSCEGCHSDYFKFKIKFEHPPKAEAEASGISDYKSAFTWMVIDIECDDCTKKCNGFVDLETG